MLVSKKQEGKGRIRACEPGAMKAVLHIVLLPAVFTLTPTPRKEVVQDMRIWNSCTQSIWLQLSNTENFTVTARAILLAINCDGVHIPESGLGGSYFIQSFH